MFEAPESMEIAIFVLGIISGLAIGFRMGQIFSRNR